MSISILIGTYGDREWADLASRRALPSASDQGASEVITRHLEEGTLAEVRNKLAVSATGDWLCFLDADDELALGYVAAMEDGIKRSRGQALLVPAVQYVEVVEEVQIGADGHETGLLTKSEPPRVLNDGRPLYEINRAVIGTLVPRELFLSVGGFRGDLPIYEDWELFLRCERAGAELIDVPDAVYRVYRRCGSRNAAPRSTTQQVYWQIRRAYEGSPA